jgi:hypothetical protein
MRQVSDMRAVALLPVPVQIPDADDLRHIDAAREAAIAADHDGDLTEALNQAVERISSGVPVQVVLGELYRAGYRAGWLDGTGDLAQAERRMTVQEHVADYFEKKAA